MTKIGTTDIRATTGNIFISKYGDDDDDDQSYLPMDKYLHPVFV